MTQTAKNYAKIMFELGIASEIVAEGKRLWESTPQLRKALQSPIVQMDAKHRVVEQIFPRELHNVLKVMCEHQVICELGETWKEYERYECEQQGILLATLTYVKEPKKEELEQFKTFLCKSYGAKDVRWTMLYDEDLIGGYILQVNDQEYDWSLRGRVNQLKMLWR